MKTEHFLVQPDAIIERFIQEVQEPGHLLAPGVFGVGHTRSFPSWQGQRTEQRMHEAYTKLALPSNGNRVNAGQHNLETVWFALVFFQAYNRVRRNY